MIVKASVAGAIGVALGLWASRAILDDGAPVGVVAIGPWRAAAKAGSLEADPYTRAVLERSGEIPLALGEGLQLVARVDDARRPLDARCSYRVGSRAPAARYWTLSLVDREGFPARERGGALRLSLERDPARRRRRVFDLRLGERPRRQLAADRRAGPVRAGAAAL